MIKGVLTPVFCVFPKYLSHRSLIEIVFSGFLIAGAVMYVTVTLSSILGAGIGAGVTAIATLNT